MYKINKTNGAIVFLDGFELLPPYLDERYYEYAAWVQAGNSPEEIEVNSLEGSENISVSPYQARAAMIISGIYPAVLEILADENTPELIRVKFEYATEFKRNDVAVLMLAGLIEGMTKEGLDLLFKQAQNIE